MKADIRFDGFASVWALFALSNLDGQLVMVVANWSLWLVVTPVGTINSVSLKAASTCSWCVSLSGIGANLLFPSPTRKDYVPILFLHIAS